MSARACTTAHERRRPCGGVQRRRDREGPRGAAVVTPAAPSDEDPSAPTICALARRGRQATKVHVSRPAVR